MMGHVMGNVLPPPMHGSFWKDLHCAAATLGLPVAGGKLGPSPESVCACVCVCECVHECTPHFAHDVMPAVVELQRQVSRAMWLGGAVFLHY